MIVMSSITLCQVSLFVTVAGSTQGVFYSEKIITSAP